MSDFKKGFEWDIEQRSIRDVNGEVIKGYKQIIRTDNDYSIAVMQESFTPMTTTEFMNTVETIASKIGADIAGYQDWGNGTTMGRHEHVITAQLKITDPLSIAGSKIEGYLTIGVGFDGGRSFYIGHTNEYLRCTNQWGRIVTDFKSRLTKNNMLRVDQIVKDIEFYREYERNLYKEFQQFEKVKIGEDVIQECIARIAKLTVEERAMTLEERLDPKNFSKQKLNKMDEIAASLRTECAEVGQNAWGMFNGITHYTTHVMSARKGDLFGNLFGAKSVANQSVYEYCKELAQ